MKIPYLIDWFNNEKLFNNICEYHVYKFFKVIISSFVKNGYIYIAEDSSNEQIFHSNSSLRFYMNIKNDSVVFFGYKILNELKASPSLPFIQSRLFWLVRIQILNLKNIGL